MSQEYTIWKEEPLQQMVLGKTGQTHARQSNWTIILHHTKGRCTDANRYRKVCSTLLIFRKMWTKTAVGYHLTPAGMTIIKKKKKKRNNKCYLIKEKTSVSPQDVGKKGPFMHSWWECELVQPLWLILRKVLKKLEIELWCLCAQLGWCFANPWTVAYQAPLSMGFPKQENWSGLFFPTPGDLP